MEVPEYRIIKGELKLKDPYNGLIPLYSDDQRFIEEFYYAEIRDPIEGLYDLLNARGKSNQMLNVPLPHEHQTFLIEQYQLPGVRVIGQNQLASIIDAVRTKILEWALQLESEGILGNGITFSDQEKSKAMTSSNINIENFQGVLGNIGNSDLKQNLNMKINKNDFESLSESLSKEGISDNDIKDLEIAIREDPIPAASGQFGRNVSSWVGKMVGKSADGSWSIGIATAGNLLASAISKYYGL